MTDSFYEKYLLPYIIDFSCRIKPVRLQRKKVVPSARGKVLEVGIGTGLNMEYYDKSKVEKIWGLDPAMKLDRFGLARKRIARTGIEVELIGLSAEKIPFDEAIFDTVLLTYTLCSIPDPVAALKEMYRVLKSDGQLIFCEHGRAPDDSIRKMQNRLTPLWRKYTGGCHLNRDIPALLKEADFVVSDLQTMYLPGFRPASYNFWGIAVKS